MNRKTENLLTHTADVLFGYWPRRQPQPDALDRVRLISHRGERDTADVRENTIQAFDTAMDAGVWGLEFDVRYTADNEPVVVHDADLSRVFGQATIIADTTWSTLRDRAPEVAHLETFLARYAGRAHLMLELKARAPGIGEARLLRLLDQLTPVTDFHILSLDSALFTAVRELPERCRLPVSKLNTRVMLEYALNHETAGLAGSYMLMTNEHLAELQAAGLQIGSGFVNNRNILWREISRGVDWVFSNQAGHLQRVLDEARSG